MYTYCVICYTHQQADELEKQRPKVFLCDCSQSSHTFYCDSCCLSWIIEQIQ